MKGVSSSVLYFLVTIILSSSYVKGDFDPSAVKKPGSAAQIILIVAMCLIGLIGVAIIVRLFFCQPKVNRNIRDSKYDIEENLAKNIDNQGNNLRYVKGDRHKRNHTTDDDNDDYNSSYRNSSKKPQNKNITLKNPMGEQLEIGLSAPQRKPKTRQPNHGQSGSKYPGSDPSQQSRGNSDRGMPTGKSIAMESRGKQSSYQQSDQVDKSKKHRINKGPSKFDNALEEQGQGYTQGSGKRQGQGQDAHRQHRGSQQNEGQEYKYDRQNSNEPMVQKKSRSKEGTRYNSQGEDSGADTDGGMQRDNQQPRAARNVPAKYKAWNKEDGKDSNRQQGSSSKMPAHARYQG